MGYAALCTNDHDDLLPLESRQPIPMERGREPLAMVSNPTNAEVWYQALADAANSGRGMVYYAATQGLPRRVL